MKVKPRAQGLVAPHSPLIAPYSMIVKRKLRRFRGKHYRYLRDKPAYAWSPGELKRAFQYVLWYFVEWGRPESNEYIVVVENG